MQHIKIKTIIAEDDYLSRQLLKGMLENFPEIEIIGEASNGLELIELAESQSPQVIFIDIDMPEINGLEAAQKLMAQDENRIIIFVTGHIDFAIKAFEISSLDYVLKPFELDRLEITVARIKTRVKQIDADFKKLARVLKGPEKLFIRHEREFHFIDAETILFIEKDKHRRKSSIYTTNHKYETYESLIDLETRLDPTYFCRSQKSYIINLRKVEKIIPWGDSTYLVRFTGSNLDAFMSRSKVQMLYEILNIKL